MFKWNFFISDSKMKIHLDLLFIVVFTNKQMFSFTLGPEQHAKVPHSTDKDSEFEEREFKIYPKPLAVACRCFKPRVKRFVGNPQNIDKVVKAESKEKRLVPEHWPRPAVNMYCNCPSGDVSLSPTTPVLILTVLIVVLNNC